MWIKAGGGGINQCILTSFLLEFFLYFKVWSRQAWCSLWPMTHTEMYWLEQRYWKDVRLNRNSFRNVSPGGCCGDFIKTYHLYVGFLCTKWSSHKVSTGSLGFFLHKVTMSGRDKITLMPLMVYFLFQPFWVSWENSFYNPNVFFPFLFFSFPFFFFFFLNQKCSWNISFTSQTLCVKHIESTISLCRLYQLWHSWQLMIFQFTCAVIFHQSISINLMKLCQLALLWV